ncbi:MAG: hypothetical protein EOP46_04065 [Sphingobacteriaceae bacterium]|nr:MAG: hypothetical protein EOP46_04065 [Sphingobacteriaceae bacterium]
MKKLTFWQRIAADTPAFFKRAQIFGIGLVSLAASLAQVGSLPEKILTILVTIGSTMTAVSQFAVKQYEQSTEK